MHTIRNEKENNEHIVQSYAQLYAFNPNLDLSPLYRYKYIVFRSLALPPLLLRLRVFFCSTVIFMIIVIIPILLLLLVLHLL